MMIPFTTFLANVQAQAAPEGLAENLQDLFRNAVVNGLIEIQTIVPCYRDFHIDFFTQSDAQDFCNVAIINGPRGIITQVYAFKPGIDCRKYYYQRKSSNFIQCWTERQRCVTCTPTTTTTMVYDYPYCNYMIPGQAACDVYGMGHEDDTWFKCTCLTSCCDHEKYFSVGPEFQLFLAPRFPCGYVVACQWEGIKRIWADQDSVPDDEDLKMGVAKFVESELSAKDREWTDVSGLRAAFASLVQEMAKRCRDERRLTPKENCNTPIIDHLLPFINPIPYAEVAASFAQGAAEATGQDDDLIGRTLRVDQINGDDATGRRGDWSKPFLTITASKNAALSGDLIEVGPGVYNETNLMKAGINYNFAAGASVVYNDPGTGPGYGIFDDRAPGAAGAFTVTGEGVFQFTDGALDNSVIRPQYNVNTLGLIVITSASSLVTIRGKSIFFGQSNQNPAQFFGGIVVNNCADDSVFVFDLLTDTFQSWNSFNDPDFPDFFPSTANGVFWQKGNCHFYIKRAISNINTYTLWAMEPIGGATANLYWQGDLLLSKGHVALYTQSISANYRVWMNCQEIRSEALVGETFGTALSLYGPARVYIIAEKISSLHNNAVYIAGGEAWITVQKISSPTQWIRYSNNDTGYGGNPNSSNPSHISCLHFEDTGSVVNGISNIASQGMLIVRGSYIKSSASGSVLVNHGSSVARTKLIECTLDATANNVATNRPVTVTTDGLQLQACVILAGSNADSSIFASSAKNVRLHGYSTATKAAHVNITLNPASGQLLIDANAGL